jgi:acyl carrier protein
MINDVMQDPLMRKLHALFVEVVDLHRDEPIDPEQVMPDADFYEDLGLDSLMAVALVIEIQRAFKRKIPENDVSTLRTLRAVHQYLKSQS